MEVITQDATISQPTESEITQISPPSHHNQSAHGKDKSTTSALPTDSLSKKYEQSLHSSGIIHDGQPSSPSNTQPQPQAKRSRSVHFAINQLCHSPSTLNHSPKFSKSLSRKGSLCRHQSKNKTVESTTSTLPIDLLSERHGCTPQSQQHNHENQPSSSNHPQPQLPSPGSCVVQLPLDQLFLVSSIRNKRPIDPKNFDHQRSRKASSNHHQLENEKIDSTTSVLPIDSLSERHGWIPRSLENDHDDQPSSSNNPQPQRQSQGTNIVHLPINQPYRKPSTGSQRSIDPESFERQRSWKDSPHHHQLGKGKAEFTTSIVPTRSLSERLGWTLRSLENTHNSQPSSSHTLQPQLESQGSCIVHLPIGELYRVPSTDNSQPSPSHNPQPHLQSQGSRAVHLPIGQLYSTTSTRNQIPVNSESLDHQRSHKTSPCCLFFGILLILVVLLVIVACILYLALMPKKPRFFIENLTFIFTQKLHPIYNFSIQSENPNSHIGIQYLDSGSASLSYESEEIATGQPPAFYHGKKVTLYFNFLLFSKDVLPKEIEEVLKANRSRVEVPLLLSIRIPVKIKLWKLQIWRMKMKIICHVSIFVLAKEVDLETQQCKDTILYTD